MDFCLRLPQIYTRGALPRPDDVFEPEGHAKEHLSIVLDLGVDLPIHRQVDDQEDAEAQQRQVDVYVPPQVVREGGLPEDQVEGDQEELGDAEEKAEPERPLVAPEAVVEADVVAGRYQSGTLHAGARILATYYCRIG